MAFWSRKLFKIPLSPSGQLESQHKLKNTAAVNVLLYIDDLKTPKLRYYKYVLLHYGYTLKT